MYGSRAWRILLNVIFSQSQMCGLSLLPIVFLGYLMFLLIVSLGVNGTRDVHTSAEKRENGNNKK